VPSLEGELAYRCRGFVRASTRTRNPERIAPLLAGINDASATPSPPVVGVKATKL